MASMEERRRQSKLKKMENGFEVPARLGMKMRDEYNALHDPNMRHYFESQHVQGLLFSTGQIDKHGRVIDLDRQKSKLNILSREFLIAQKTEERRQQEEMDMRYRVQKKRFEELERTRKEEAILRIKQQKEIGKEIVGIMGRSTVSDGSRSSSFGASSFFKNNNTRAIKFDS